MEPINFVKMKVPELKTYLQVRGITVSNKRREELLDLCEKAHELAIETLDEENDQSDTSAKLLTDGGAVPDPYSLKSDWTTDFSSLSNYTWGDMYVYLIVKEGYDHESLKAYKSLEGFRLHWDGHVQSLLINTSTFCGCHLIKFSVKPTEREKTQIDNKTTYNGWLVVKENGSVHCAHCPCIGGSDGACRHVGAALINLEETLREGSVVTCTGTKCTWKKKKRAHEEVTPVEKMEFTKPTIGKEKKSTCKPRATIFDPRPSYMAQKNFALEFRSLLLECSSSAVGLHVMAEPATEEKDDEGGEQERLDENENTDSIAQAVQPVPYCIENLSPLPEGATVPQIKEACVAVKRKLCFSDDEIAIVEKKTRLQSKCADWYRFKWGRISASKCKRVASLKPSTSPSKALKEVMGYSDIPQTTAMREGLEKEDEIAQVFVSEMAKQGCIGVTVENCGFFVSKSHGFLGASPDKVIHAPTQSGPGVLEMKYIQVKPGVKLEDVLLKQSVCTKTDSGCLILNKNHKYYFQLCHQMFSTKYTWGYFIACGTNEEFFMERVIFVEDFWTPILQKLSSFYEEVMLPEIVFPRVKYGMPRTKL